MACFMKWWDAAAIEAQGLAVADVHRVSVVDAGRTLQLRLFSFVIAFREWRCGIGIERWGRLHLLHNWMYGG